MKPDGLNKMASKHIVVHGQHFLNYINVLHRHELKSVFEYHRKVILLIRGFVRYDLYHVSCII